MDTEKKALEISEEFRDSARAIEEEHDRRRLEAEQKAADIRLNIEVDAKQAVKAAEDLRKKLDELRPVKLEARRLLPGMHFENCTVNIFMGGKEE